MLENAPDPCGRVGEGELSLSQEVKCVGVCPAVKVKDHPKIDFTYTVYKSRNRLPPFEGCTEITDFETPKLTNRFCKYMEGYGDHVAHLVAMHKDVQAEKMLRRTWARAPEINSKRYLPAPLACSPCMLVLPAPLACSGCMRVLTACSPCMLPPLTPRCRSDVFTQQEAHDLCNYKFLRDVIVVYFMRFFARNNANIHVVGFDHLLRYGDFDKNGEFKRTPQRRNLRSDLLWENAVIPAGHLENGGVVVAPINFPRFASPCMLPLHARGACSCCMLVSLAPLACSWCMLLLHAPPCAWSFCMVLLHAPPSAWSCCMLPPLHAPVACSCCMLLLHDRDACSHLITRKVHWQFAVLRLDNNLTRPVVEVRDNDFNVVDPKARKAGLYFANACSLILRKRYPEMLPCTVHRKRCSGHHSVNACGLCVIAQTMLFAENKDKTHQVTKTVTDKLRKWILTYLMRFDTNEIDIPVEKR